MKATWSENFFNQVNETQDTVRNLTKDCEMIRAIKENIVEKSELQNVHNKLEKMVSVDTFRTLEHNFENHQFVLLADFDTLT